MSNRRSEGNPAATSTFDIQHSIFDIQNPMPKIPRRQNFREKPAWKRLSNR